MKIAREEIFGPVAAVIRVKDYDEALSVANDTDFGLSSGICTTSLKHASHFKRNADAGMVMVNLPTAGVDYHVPFGGRKGSSYGPREQGRYAIEFYTTVKTAYTLPSADDFRHRRLRAVRHDARERVRHGAAKARIGGELGAEDLAHLEQRRREPLRVEPGLIGDRAQPRRRADRARRSACRARRCR